MQNDMCSVFTLSLPAINSEANFLTECKIIFHSRSFAASIRLQIGNLKEKFIVVDFAAAAAAASSSRCIRWRTAYFQGMEESAHCTDDDDIMGHL